MALRHKDDVYGLPRHMSVWLRAAIVVVVGAIVLTLVWLVMPHTPLGVALDAMLTLLVVFGAVFWALSGRDTDTSRAGRLDAGGGREREPESWMEPTSRQSQ